jgi:predicted tellurium resistance membrane protein TerC
MDMFLSQLASPESWIALLTLTLLEIVLGIDNVVFISILSGRLPQDQQARGRMVGLSLALITRILLLMSITWVMQLTKPFFSIWGVVVSGKSLILLGGGLFLIAKSTHEIHNKLEGDEEHEDSDKRKKRPSFWNIIIQIMLLDVVFSLDSVITAVGMAESLWIMISAVIISVGFMLVFSGFVARFVEKHPTVKMLALSFLVLIGVNLIAEGLGQHIPKGYTYFSMAFSMGVEMLNLRLRKKHAAQAPLHLRRNSP